ncbi:MAG: helix-turn-helix domain-containing protein [Acidimicrobiales bacterium]
MTMTDRTEAPAGVRDTLAAAGAAFGVDAEVLCGPSRVRHAVEARHVAAYVLREVAGLSYPAIGRALGGRDHTTAMHAVARVRVRMDGSPRLRRTVDDLVASAAGLAPQANERTAPPPDVGTVALVHPRLSPGAAGALGMAGFARVAHTGACEIWVRHPAA